MKMLRLLAGVLAVAGFLFAPVLIGSGSAAISPTLSAVEIVWQLPDGNGVGSGVYVGNGLIVTARHVVRDATGHTMVVVDQSGEHTTASVKWVSSTTDVAVVRLNAPLPSLPAASLDKRVPAVGEHVEVVGCPFGNPFVHTFGAVTGTPENPFPSWQDAIPISAEVHPGNSGGPAYDDKGEVIGIVVGAILDANKQPIANIMISAREVAGI